MIACSERLTLRSSLIGALLICGCLVPLRPAEAADIYGIAGIFDDRDSARITGTGSDRTSGPTDRLFTSGNDDSDFSSIGSFCVPGAPRQGESDPREVGSGDWSSQTGDPSGDPSSSSSDPAGDGTVTLAAVPEPSTFVLLGIGFAALAFRRRRTGLR